jgi:hypothetical protein
MKNKTVVITHATDGVCEFTYSFLSKYLNQSKELKKTTDKNVLKVMKCFDSENLNLTIDIETFKIKNR